MVAQRIADEMGGALGGVVGYQVRFTEQVSPDTRVKLMTDGILLAELQRDRNLRTAQLPADTDYIGRTSPVDFFKAGV